jgi:16S rRNA (adenine1518-N6/adenine1519-N6)-dimethyltransferase
VIDPNTVRRVVRAADLDPSDVVLEVGPGLGSLTLGLIEVASHVIAVEIDRGLATRLPRTVAERAPGYQDRLDVLTADALTVAAADLPGRAPTAIVANLPYNIAVPVVLHLLATLPSLQRGLVMVQSEVADRIVAPPGSRTYGTPSVKIAWYAEASRAGAIGRRVFWPAPNVDSGLVRLICRNPPPTKANRLDVFAVVDAAFGQRRKTLRAALAPWAGSPAAAETALRAADIDPGRRGEALSVVEFAHLAEHRPAGVTQ